MTAARVSLSSSVVQSDRELLAKREFRAFVEAAGSRDRHLVFHDFDADGVTAGIVMARALERSGRAVARIVTGKDRNAWNPSNRAAMSAASPDRLYVLDLGSRDEPILDVPTCFVDHHRPDGTSHATLISGYEWDPIPNTSYLSWLVSSEIADVSDLDWIAAIGIVSDLGEKAPFALLETAKQKYGAKWLKEATVLVNSARRSPEHHPEIAVTALESHDDPKSLVTSSSVVVESLREARAIVAAELAEAKKAAPKFAGNVALVRVRSRAQIHPLIAQIWRGRLPKYHVVVANEGYADGRIHFSARSQGDHNVLDFLQSIELRLEDEGGYGHGHDHAAGGTLSDGDWNRFLTRLGFDESHHVQRS
jgi:single-stranded-DNA-specific exonuclease